MKAKMIVWVLALLLPLIVQAQENDRRYVEVTGISEMEIIPDEIHYLIEIQEYFEEEFDGVSKPEQYKTKVPIERIEKDLMQVIRNAGIPDSAIRIQKYGNNWRHQGHDFLISKQLDITLKDYKQIDKIVKKLNTRGIHSMRIGKLDNKDILTYHQKNKIEALKAARQKATYLVEALGKKLGPVLRITENANTEPFAVLQSNAMSMEAGGYDNFRTILLKYSITARFEIKD
ncbi:secreted protein containing DUF541 [gut metagenome]|uniref:Secreted protein containing DUF541 n=1 Tax=gut metagenome TaxID=749906 RepID=J9GYV0_9ZZZZ